MANKSKKQDKKQVKKQNKKKINNVRQQSKNSERFSFDNEIIIGVTKKQNNEKKDKIKDNSKKANNLKSNLENNNQLNKTIGNNEIFEGKQEKTNRKSIKTKRIIKYGMILVLFIILILCAMFSPLFNIKQIIVEGNKQITKDEILSLAQINVNENMYKVNTGKVTKQIKENPYIDKIDIERKLPSTLIIKVEERTPIFLIEYVNSYLYIDKQGYILKISNEKSELPILQGMSTLETEFKVGNRLEKEDIQKLAVLSKVMDTAEANEISNIITRIDIENVNNIKLIFEAEQKVAYLGDITNLVTKMPTIKLILEKEQGIAGEIFVNMDLNKENAMFREKV